MSGKSDQDKAIFSVSPAMHVGSWLVCEHPALWRKLANLESSILADDLDTVPIVKPVWVTGLARSGSTLLLELLAGVPGVVSHTYQDFPAVFTPYAWRRLLRLMGGSRSQARERAHRDGMLVTGESPEAMEEPLWMSFFSNLHADGTSAIIPPDADPRFAVFLQNHIRKLLLSAAGSRYLSKANYQITRMEYLLQAFSDARFLIPVRDPVIHIASLMKTHALFARGQRANPRARAHLRRVGHFEFGLDRHAIHLGKDRLARDIAACWQAGDEIGGWARYWAGLYEYALDRVAANPALAATCCFVSHEKLCAQPLDQLRRVFAHCDYPAPEGYLEAAAARIRAPDYYQPRFSDSERALIATHTDAVVARLAVVT